MCFTPAHITGSYHQTLLSSVKHIACTHHRQLPSATTLFGETHRLHTSQAATISHYSLQRNTSPAYITGSHHQPLLSSVKHIARITGSYHQPLLSSAKHIACIRHRPLPSATTLFSEITWLRRAPSNARVALKQQRGLHVTSWTLVTHPNLQTKAALKTTFWSWPQPWNHWPQPLSFGLTLKFRVLRKTVSPHF